MSKPVIPYPDAESYIRGEYGGEIPLIKQIIRRHLSHGMGLALSVDQMALEIVGYYTGCLNPDGTPRVPRPERR